MTKSKEMQEFQDNLARGLYGITLTEALDKGICLQCREIALPRCYSQSGRKEYEISGLCERCFDSIVEDSEPRDEDDDLDNEPAF